MIWFEKEGKIWNKKNTSLLSSSQNSLHLPLLNLFLLIHLLLRLFCLCFTSHFISITTKNVSTRDLTSFFLPTSTYLPISLYNTFYSIIFYIHHIWIRRVPIFYIIVNVCDGVFVIVFFIYYNLIGRTDSLW